ncbi:MAG TPA: hypothetical protein VEK13_07620 [Thermoplasmata archaeon]|nr:hypothetical protein [Thermoplasmata archaeon]
MKTMTTWFVAVMMLLGLVLLLHQLGVDVAASISSGLRSIEHFLNQPLL